MVSISHPKHSKTPLVMIVLDGWGYSTRKKGNAVYLAHPKNFNQYWNEFPHTLLQCTGPHVGLSGKTQGNSEVGHIHLGAGRIVWQPMEFIDRSIRDSSFFKNPALLKAILNVKKHNSQLHLMGLCSDEGVHAQLSHLFALLKLAKQHKLNKVFIHCFLDGRDVPERSAVKYIRQIQKECKKLNVGKIASLIGRYYSMDRDQNWNRTQKAYDLLVHAKGHAFVDPAQAITAAYARGNETDYYVEPSILFDPVQKTPIAIIQPQDSVIFFNFRTDRARQLTHAFVDSHFTHFVRDKKIPLTFVSMTQYDSNLRIPIAFRQLTVKNNLAHVLSAYKCTQLRIAETEKYAHVTFFFNSQTEKPVTGEHRILVPSPKVKSYDLQPEMSAREITKKVLPEIASGKFDFVLINFANPDLVGHSGKLPAVIQALHVVDECIGKIVTRVRAQNGTCIITADHGNAEEMLYPNGSVCPSHSRNKVPFILVPSPLQTQSITLKPSGELADVAPTILALLGLPKPKEMTGISLLK